jgi:RNA polymerase sigma factor (sigma-70 family)
MDRISPISEEFEQSRRHLTSVAYSMLGSISEAEDAVQEAWLRLDRSDAESINDMRAWLTTVVGRICLDMLRTRKASRMDYGTWLPEPVVEDAFGDAPEARSVIEDTIGMALLVVMESLSPPERLSFVLHDVFGVSFEEIGRIMDRSTEAARQLASRARRRVRSTPEPDADVATQRRVVDAFLAAARSGDFDALIKVLDPDVVFRFDIGAASRRPVLTGAEAVAKHVLSTAPRFIGRATPALVNGAAGALVGTRDAPVSVVGFTIVGGRIVALDLIADPSKLRHLRIGT